MVTAALHRRAPRGSQIVDALLAGTERLSAFVHRRARLLPGLTGAGLVAWGAAQVYVPAGWILGGVFLLAADNQIKLRRSVRGGE